jgi:hypothetical protein
MRRFNTVHNWVLQTLNWAESIGLSLATLQSNLVIGQHSSSQHIHRAAIDVTAMKALHMLLLYIIYRLLDLISSTLLATGAAVAATAVADKDTRTRA